MKKFIVLFFITYIFSYANYLISNSEIVLFYDKDYKSIQYIRGDIFTGVDIAKIEGDLILDRKEIIHLSDYLQEVEVLPDNNKLKLHYNIKGKIMCVSIIPSMYDREELYFIVEFVNFLPDNKKVDFSFKIVPQKDNKYVEYNKSMESYSYDDFYFKARNYQGKVYIGRNSTLEEKKLEEYSEKIKKYQDDNLYYIVENIDYKKPINFTIKFYEDFKNEDKFDGDFIIAKELAYWEKNNYTKGYTDKKKLFLTELKNLNTITSRAVIPEHISYSKSDENLNNKIKLYYLNSIYNENFNINKFFEDINIRKSDNEAVVYYTFLFKYLNRSGNYITGNLLQNKIIPEVLSLLDYLEEIDNEIINVRDNINNYYWYYELISNIENRIEFEKDKEFIQEKKRLLLDYLNKNYVLNDGLKTKKDSEKSYYKNIKFINFLPREKQLEILKRDYFKYYNRLYGILQIEKEKNEVDIKYNLDFIIKLYENGETKLGDILFANLKVYLKKNKGYILPVLSLNKENQPGIYGELLYLYFTAEEYREKYGN
mgnify:CR=1 FL=1